MKVECGSSPVITLEGMKAASVRPPQARSYQSEIPDEATLDRNGNACSELTEISEVVDDNLLIQFNIR